jgi:Iron-containing redox enzyme
VFDDRSLPSPRGPLSDALNRALLWAPGPLALPAGDHDPWGEDAQVALYTCLELGYRGFVGVDPEWEVEPGLVGVTNRLGRQYLQAVSAQVGPVRGGSPPAVGATLEALAAGGEGPSLSGWMAGEGTLEQLREFAVHRSAYQLKEADPHTRALPRMAAGLAKAAFVEIQADEYGGGRPGDAHQELFATTLRALGLHHSYGAYLDHLPAPTLATVNLLSLFGRSRRWLGACVGHLALFEMTSVGPMGRYAAAVRRLTGDSEAARFYDVHVAADQHHQRLAISGLVEPFVAAEPDLAADVVFGARALAVVEGRFTGHVLACWRDGRPSLRQPLPAPERTLAA